MSILERLQAIQRFSVTRATAAMPVVRQTTSRIGGTAGNTADPRDIARVVSAILSLRSSATFFVSCGLTNGGDFSATARRRPITNQVARLQFMLRRTTSAVYIR